MASNEEMDCPLANIVFDLRKHDEETRKRLKSAADFVLKYAFDNPHTNPIDAMEFPQVYLGCGNDNFESFIGAKLAALNMLHLEDDISKNYPDMDPHQMSDQDLNSIVEKILWHKDQKKRDAEQSYPKGTGISSEMLWAVLTKHEPYAADKNASSDLCPFCLKTKSSISALQCGHKVHSACLERLFKKNKLCPICGYCALPLQVEYPKWIRDLGKVRDFLTRDSCGRFLDERYVTSVSAFHAIMAAHLEELHLHDVLDNFKRQVWEVMDYRKEACAVENGMIKTEVMEFLKDCIGIEDGLVKRFHEFMQQNFIALRLDCAEQIHFENMIKVVDVSRLKTGESIHRLRTFVHGVEYHRAG